MVSLNCCFGPLRSFPCSRPVRAVGRILLRVWTKSNRGKPKWFQRKINDFALTYFLQR